MLDTHRVQAHMGLRFNGPAERLDPYIAQWDSSFQNKKNVLLHHLSLSICRCKRRRLHRTQGFWISNWSKYRLTINEILFLSSQAKPDYIKYQSKLVSHRKSLFEPLTCNIKRDVYLDVYTILNRIWLTINYGTYAHFGYITLIGDQTSGKDDTRFHAII